MSNADGEIISLVSWTVGCNLSLKSATLSELSTVRCNKDGMSTSINKAGHFHDAVYFAPANQYHNSSYVQLEPTTFSNRICILSCEPGKAISSRPKMSATFQRIDSSSSCGTTYIDLKGPRKRLPGCSNSHDLTSRQPYLCAIRIRLIIK